MYRPNYFMLKRAADKNKDDSGDVWKPVVGGLLGAGLGGTAGYYLSAPSNKTVGTTVGVVGGGLAGAAAGQHSRQKKVQQKKKLQKQKQEQKNLDYLKSMSLSAGLPAAAGGIGLGARQAIRGWKMPISRKAKVWHVLLSMLKGTAAGGTAGAVGNYFGTPSEGLTKKQHYYKYANDQDMKTWEAALSSGMSGAGIGLIGAQMKKKQQAPAAYQKSKTPSKAPNKPVVPDVKKYQELMKNMPKIKPGAGFFGGR